MSIPGVQIYNKAEFLVGEADQVAGNIVIARPAWERRVMIITGIIATLGLVAGGAGVTVGLLHIIPIAGSGTLVITGAVFTATGGMVVFAIKIRRKLFERTVMKSIDKQNELISAALSGIARKAEQESKAEKRAERAEKSRSRGSKKAAPKASKAAEKEPVARDYVKGLEADLRNLIVQDKDNLIQLQRKKILHVYRDEVESEEGEPNKVYNFDVYFCPSNKIKNALKKELIEQGATETAFAK